jgi:lipopolysaccharide/colanic/teichoic acid biosynthesis glycosyltransferase
MSLVGPRPERPEFVEQFRREFPGYMLRHSLRAGVTGWAQVNGLRGRSGIEERLAYDLDYARRWSLLFDLEILVRTLFQVIAGRNAY